MDPDQAQFQTLQSALAGRFFVERELGRGGMGVVYLARDVALDRPVAIKVLPRELAADPRHRERFLREARTAAGLAHPNIVPIHLVEAGDDLVCFVMGYVSAETLGDRVRRSGPLPPDEVSRIIREVAWALAYAHGRGVIHRDIKPDNILLEHGTGRAMVTDFGIARAADQSTLTSQEEIIGTVQYMPPEQADAGAELDGRSDLYALGVTAFYALTGRLPFEAATAPALLAMHLAEPAPPVTSIRPGIPARLADAVGRCLAKEPSARFPSAEAMADALGEMAVSKAIPPSILQFRETTASAGQLFFLGGGLYLVAGMGYKAEWAAALGVVWAVMAGLGFLQLLFAARAVVRAGHTVEEVGEAAVQITRASLHDRNTAVTMEQGRKLGEYVRRPLGRIIMAGLGTFYLAIPVILLLEGWTAESAFDVIFSVLGYVICAALGLFLWAGALRLGFFKRWSEDPFSLERGGKRAQRWARRAWDNPIMRLLFRVAGVGAAPPGAGDTVVEQAATEMILGKAADDLFSALPKEDRKRLAEVPQVIRDLEAAAGALRTRRDELERAIADAGAVEGDAASKRADIVKELVEAKEAASERLKRVVSALENLRLDLLRLRAGVGEAAEITEALEAARQVGRDISAEIEARAEAAQLWDRTHTRYRL